MDGTIRFLLATGMRAADPADITREICTLADLPVAWADVLVRAAVDWRVLAADLAKCARNPPS